uniref:5'-3' exoribonuclease 2 isoform X1 n=1 Tax=Elaeis guineensis var. tenera TaxID=51953 RepID=A0A8N4I6T7_ELAGV|nr:5'-3' exoribonuclease 2 isoform X1 [Elaeis guineensis]
MDRYQRVEKPRAEEPINENEIRITAQGRIRNYITYATTLLQEKGSEKIVLKAMGRAINKTVMIAELIKRRIVGLHQNTSIESTDITDTWEPLEEGLLPYGASLPLTLCTFCFGIYMLANTCFYDSLETTRHVSTISITLSKKELDTSSPGYQFPIPADQVKPWTDIDHEEEISPGVRGRGRGGRGRGRGRGYGNGVVADHGTDGGDYGGRGYAGRGRGRGRGRGFRGRGRGYGGGYGGGYDGGDTHQESDGYEYNGPRVPLRQGRGRGAGMARGRGRGRNYRSDGPVQANA